MKRQIQQLRRLFVRTKNYNATLARPVSHSTYDDDDDGGNRLSGAFIVVLLLHIIAVVGVFAFARIKESRDGVTTTKTPAPTGPAKASPPKPAPPVAATAPVPAPTTVTTGNSLKAPAPGARSSHIVKPGENLGRIAFAYDVPVAELVALNKLKSQDDIQVGQALTIPEKGHATAETKLPAAPTPASKATVPARDKKPVKTYVVRKGDTATKIARENGCTYEELVKLNNIKDPKKIVPGQVLKLPQKNG
jgi:LysM repeat protein